MHVKGMELDGDEWRQNKASALTAATSERGASVVRPWGFPIDMGMLFPEVTGLKEKPDPDREEGIAAWYKPYKEFTVASNCMGICLYPGLFNIPSPQQTLDAFRAITGRDFEPEGLPEDRRAHRMRTARIQCPGGIYPQGRYASQADT